MASKLELFYFDACPYCHVVMNKLAELGIKSVEMHNILEDSSAMQRLVSDTGRRTVPCLYVDGAPKHESKEIIVWLEQNAKVLRES